MKEAERILNKLNEKNIYKNEPIDKKVIKMFEEKTNILFPEEFIEFYTKIANGCIMIDGFKLKNFEDISEDISTNISVIKDPFPFTKYWIWENEPNDQLQEKIVCGNIQLIDIGDSQTWNLILTGNEAGQMWFFTDVGMQPYAPRRSFLDWFEFWLDGHDDYFAEFEF